MGADANPFPGGQMKSTLMIIVLLMTAIAFGQEKQPPEFKAERKSIEQSQSSGNPQGEVIIDIPIDNRVLPPLDWTGHALKDIKGSCKVHHVKLTRAMVPILYGLRPSPTYSKEIEERLFPNALTCLEGGCAVMRVKEAIVLRCKKCVAAKTRLAKSKQ
jgi:hypothetical protein